MGSAAGSFDSSGTDSSSSSTGKRTFQTEWRKARGKKKADAIAAIVAEVNSLLTAAQKKRLKNFIEQKILGQLK